MSKYLIILALLLSGCASWHCKKCLQSGKLKSDIVQIPVIVERVVHDTIASEPLFIERLIAGDTINTETIKWKIREHYNTVTKDRFIEVECPEKTILVEIPCGTDVQIGWPKGPVIGIGLLILIIIFFAGRGSRAKPP